MRKLKYSIIFMICAVLFTACGKKDSNADETSQIIVEKEFEPIVADDISGYVEEKLDLENYSIKNQYSVDANTTFLWFEMTNSENGYYFEGDGDKIMFMDRMTGQSVPLCNKADCEHEYKDENCNAYYNGSVSIMSDDICFDLNYLQFYDGNLYTLAYTIGGNVYLYKISEDGSAREEYMHLYKMDFSSLNETGEIHYRSPEICIHRGYVYYIMPFEETPTIRRMKLGGDETEVIFEMSGERGSLYRIRPYGDYILFQAGNFIDETCVKINAGVFAYNINNGKLQLVKKDIVATYTVVDGILYYSTEEGIMQLDLNTMESNTIVKTESKCAFSVDRQYIYVEDEDITGGLNIYTNAGEYVCSTTEYLNPLHFGDEDYLFGEGWLEEEGFSVMMCLKISDIADGNVEWRICE